MPKLRSPVWIVELNGEYDEQALRQLRQQKSIACAEDWRGLVFPCNKAGEEAAREILKEINDLANSIRHNFQ